MEDDRIGHEDPRSEPAFTSSGGLANSDSKKAEAQADNMKYQFHPLLLPSMRMNKFERVRDAMESFALASSSEPLSTNPTEVSKVIVELKIGPNGVPNRGLKIFLGKR